MIVYYNSRKEVDIMDDMINLYNEKMRIREEMETINRKIDDLLSFDLWTPEAQRTLDLRYKKLQSRLEEINNELSA